MTAPGPAAEASAQAAAFWKAVAMLRYDRRAALDSLEASFAGGASPGRLDGPHAGRFLTTTVGRGLDPLFGAMAAVWMPWRGKTFDAATGDGRNRFTTGGGRVISWRYRDYGGVRPEAPGEVTAFRFVTSIGPSATVPDRSVLRIDYDLPDNPDWPIRQVLDELVAVGGGVYLGQGLLRRGSGHRRAAWFMLEW